MRVSRLIFAASFAAIVSLSSGPATAADMLRLGGMGGASELLRRLGASFTQRTGVKVEVIPGLGTGGGLKAVTEGMLDLALGGRKLKPDELAWGLVEVATLRTPYVFVTSHPAPSALTGRDIVAAYAAEKATWPDGTPLRIVLRPRLDSDTPVLAALFPGMEAAMSLARQRGDTPVAPNDQDNADLAERLAGSLSGSTYTQVMLERRDLRMVPLGQVAPTLEAFESGAYPHTRIFYVVQPARPSAAARQFVQFLQTDEAVRVMREAFCLPGGE